MRFIIAPGGAAAIALVLFLLMHVLISGEQEFRASAGGNMIDIIRVREERRTLEERAPPEEPPPPARQPPTPRLGIADTDQPLSAIEMPRLAVQARALGGPDVVGPYIGRWGPGDPSSEGDVIPIARIAPVWPREALLEGTNGWVELEFTILPDGRVADPVVVDSEPPRLFDRNARTAILKWKFKPRIVDGVAVPRRAVQRIDFILDQ